MAGAKRGRTASKKTQQSKRRNSDLDASATSSPAEKPSKVPKRSEKNSADLTGEVESSPTDFKSPGRRTRTATNKRSEPEKTRSSSRTPVEQAKRIPGNTENKFVLPESTPKRSGRLSRLSSFSDSLEGASKESESLPAEPHSSLKKSEKVHNKNTENELQSLESTSKRSGRYRRQSSLSENSEGTSKEATKTLVEPQSKPKEPEKTGTGKKKEKNTPSPKHTPKRVGRQRKSSSDNADQTVKEPENIPVEPHNTPKAPIEPENVQEQLDLPLSTDSIPNSVTSQEEPESPLLSPERTPKKARRSSIQSAGTSENSQRSPRTYANEPSGSREASQESNIAESADAVDVGESNTDEVAETNVLLSNPDVLESEMLDCVAGPSDEQQMNETTFAVNPPPPPKMTAADLGFIEDEDGVIKIDDLVIPPAPAPALTNDVPDSRLIITDLIIQNFKSYAGIQTISNFEKNFTAVVGPNGSGKSNVIDSLLFVFGYRAKKIRSKKVSHLIHKSDLHPDLTFCSVTVNFAIIKDGEGEKFEIVRDSRFVLKRTAYSDDSSFYEICNKRVPYKEVSKTLKAYGIDLEHSRFLILQGEIEAISLMQPKGEKESDTGMLEYIEDIIGSNRLIDPIKYFNEKVNKLNEERKEKLTQLKLVEKEVEDLEGPKNQAIEYLRLENKIYLTENSLYHLQCYGAEKELEETRENKRKHTEQMKVLKEKLENLRTSKKQLETEIQKLTSEYETFIRKYEDNKEEFASLEREDAANMMNIKHAKEKARSLEKNLETSKNELEKLKKQTATYEKETSELQIRKQKFEEEKDVEEKKMTEVMGSLKEETNQLQDKKDKFEAELIKLKDNVYKIKSEMDLAQSELNLCVSGEKKEKEKLSTLVSNRQSSEQNVKKEQTLMEEEESKVKSVEKELASLKKQFEDAKVKKDVFSKQYDNYGFKLNEARNTITASKNQGGIMQALSKEKAKGKLAGVYGRLGSLGAIDEKYDVAISTVCGQLDNIVTNNLATAQECVEYLKRNNSGYATFIPLDKMKVWEQSAHTKIVTPENVPRLFDLIRVNDKSLLPAFYFALRNTLVANDLEQATRIGLQGKQRYRVVTLRGEIIDLSGTMSGGGTRLSRGRMGQTVNECNLKEEDIDQMKADMSEAERNCRETEKMIRSLDENISQKTSLLSSLHHSLKKRRLHFNAYTESVTILSNQISEQQVKVNETTVDKKKVKQLEDSIKEITKRYDTSVEKTSVVEEKVSKLQTEILKISKGKFSEVKKTVDQLEKKLNEVVKAITKSSVNMKTAKRNIKKNEDKTCTFEKDMEANKGQLQRLKEQQNMLTDKGQKATELISENEGAFDMHGTFCFRRSLSDLVHAKVGEFKEKRTSVKKELEVFAEKEHKMKSEEIEFRNSIKKFESEESTKNAFIRHINTKMAKLKLNEVENDPMDIQSISKEEAAKLSANVLSTDIEIMKAKLEEQKPDLSAIKEYQKKEKLYQEKQKAVDEITAEKNMQSMRYDELRKRRISEFLKGFSAIAKKLKEIYQMITLGGDAELELVDSFDPFSKGIEFSVRPPKKSWKFMRNLSGGEKTLSSLALVFALHYYRPTPFYVMDEIDAALDVRNVAIVGYYLKEKTVNTQFIIVSLRNVMNELSDQLLGIFKVNNCTRILMLRNAGKWVGTPA